MELSNEEGTALYVPFKPGNYGGSSPNRISYSAHLTTDSTILNNDVQIHSIELSSRTSNPIKISQKPLSNIEFPLGNSTFITSISPKIVTTVSETYLPMESSRSSLQIISDNSGTNKTNDNTTLSYDSFEKHFLWNTSLFCSQTLPMTEDLLTQTKLDNIFNKRKHENNAAVIDKISTHVNDNKEILDQKSYNYFEMPKISLNTNRNDYLNSNSSANKRNPYSIEEILKKPEKQMRFTDPFFFNHNEVVHCDEIQNAMKSMDVNSGTIECSDQTSDSSLLSKRARIRLKVYDISV